MRTFDFCARLGQLRRDKTAVICADMAELAAALDSGSNFRKKVEVQILLPAPNKNKTNPRKNLEFVLFFTRDYFGLKIKL